MMAKKQKFFKNLLASSAIASIVASLGSSSVAFGGAVPDAVLMIDNAALTDTAAGGQNHWNEIDQNGLPVNPGAFVDAPQDNEAFTYGGNFILNANRPDAIITAINLVNHQPGDLTVNENLSIGSIVRNVGGANTLTIKIVAGHTATLTGTPAAKDNHGFNADPNTYTGLGNVELGGVGSTLIVRSFNNEDIAVGNVSTAVHQQGVLTFVTSGSVGAIGADDHRLLTVNIGNVGPRGGGATVTLNGDVYAGEIKFTRATSILKVGGGSTINGNILNAVGRNNRGTLTFLGAGRVIGNIGVDGAALENINIGNGEVTLNGNVYAENTNLTDAASILKLTAGHTITGNVVTTVGDGEGVLTFEGSGGVTGTIGDGHALAEVNFNGAGEVHLRQAASAETFTFNQAATLHAHDDITGNVHFKGYNGIIKLENAKKVTGVITTARNGEGTLTFDGEGEVTGNIGTIDVDNPANDKRIALINTGGITRLKGNVYTNDLHFGNAAGHAVTIGGNFAGGVTFDAVNYGILTFNGVAGPYDFDSTIANGDHGTLNVHADLTATNAQIGKIKTINIGTIAPAPHTLKIDASNGNVNLLGRVNDPAALVAVDQTINFLDADSVLHLYSSNAVNNTITFANNLLGGGGNEGIVLMEGNGVLLTVQSVGGKSLGTAGQELKELQIKGPVTIAGGVANGLDVHETDALNIMKGARFTDESTTSAQIANIHIGADDGFGAGIGPATYILDAEHIDFNLNAHAANQIVFDHADAQLTLRNSAAANKTITLRNDLNPGAGADGKGIVELHSAMAGNTLTIAGAGRHLGTAVNNLKKVIFSGAGKFNTQ
ncbi:MAG: beta strand repeat-containing protein, partial [Candidatus Tisiphia sp.]